MCNNRDTNRNAMQLRTELKRTVTVSDAIFCQRIQKKQSSACRGQGSTVKMLLLVFVIELAAVLCQETAKERPYIALPVPFELPKRNDHSDQCWLRIEDVELIETVSVYCFIAQAFLKDHMHNYNKKKSTEDQVDLDIWTEPKKVEDTVTENLGYAYQKPLKDWKSTTVLDPIIHRRLYVTPKADCRIIMCSREAMSNYRVDCESILYMINDKMQNRALSSKLCSLIMVLAGLLTCIQKHMFV